VGMIGITYCPVHILLVVTNLHWKNHILTIPIHTAWKSCGLPPNQGKPSCTYSNILILPVQYHQNSKKGTMTGPS